MHISFTGDTIGTAVALTEVAGCVALSVGRMTTSLKSAIWLPPPSVAPSIHSISEHSTGRSIERHGMSAGGPEEGPHALVGGRLLAEITNRIVALMREHYGRGPIKAKTYVLDNLIVCVLSDGFTAIERTMVEGGEPNRVLDMRRDFQRMMKQRYSEMIEQLTGRKVLAFLSQAHIEPDLTIEMFLMDGPVPGFGALELVDPAASENPGQGL
jgi:uncharacterized protein YbcI